MSDQADLIAALTPVSKAFNNLGIRFYIGGSVASSFHGAARSTLDVDLVAEMTEETIPGFLNHFGEDFYVSPSAIKEAVQNKSSFNLIHLPTSFKVDVFVSRQRAFDNSVMDRAVTQNLGNKTSLKVPIATAEDAILCKLEWYRKTNETSERQWDDVTRLMKLLGDSADISYLKKSAAGIGVDDLLDRLIES